MPPQRHLTAHFARDSGSFPRASRASICHRLRFSLHKVCKAIRVMPMNTTSPNERIISNALYKQGAGNREHGVIHPYSQLPDAEGGHAMTKQISSPNTVAIAPSISRPLAVALLGLGMASFVFASAQAAQDEH